MSRDQFQQADQGFLGQVTNELSNKLSTSLEYQPVLKYLTFHEIFYNEMRKFLNNWPFGE